MALNESGGGAPFPLWSEFYIPNILGFGSVSYLSGEGTHRQKPPLGFGVQQVVMVQALACSQSVPCGWCPLCLGSEEHVS